MRRGELGWAWCFAGLPWSYLLIHLFQPFQQLDLWHANTWWMEAWLLGMLGVHAMNRQLLGELPRAFWGLLLWATWGMLWIFTSQTVAGQPYPMAFLAGVGNAWVAFLLLSLMVTWTPACLSMVFDAVFWSGVVLILYGWCQVFALDQFFRTVDVVGPHDTIGGMLGNPTHFACQLTLWLPWALIRPGRQRLWVIPMLGLLLLTRSSTAVVLSAGIVCAWFWQRSRRWGAGLGVALFLSMSLWFLTHAQWLNPYGRLTTWLAWWPVLRKRALFGWGLGFTKMAAQQLDPHSPFFQWKHLHNEYLQWWLETGVVGMLLLGWALWGLWQRRLHGTRTPLRWSCGMTVVALLLMAILQFPFHLWQVGGWGLLGIAGWLMTTNG